MYMNRLAIAIDVEIGIKQITGKSLGGVGL
jgi:hypothetical protein